MRFRQPSHCALPLRSPAGSALYRQTTHYESFMQRPAQRVDGRGIFEWCLSSREQSRQALRLVFQKIAYILFPFGYIAWLACQTQITYPVRSSTTLWNHMLNLKRSLLAVTITTLALKFLQHIFSQFKTEERTLLVVYSTDFRILDGLRIKTCHFDADGRDMTIFHQTSHPGLDLGEPTCQGWR